jgi:hypothetical protein
MPRIVSESFHVLPPRGCSNCGDPQIAVYCARCGEKQPGHHDRQLKHFVHDVLHEMAHIDGKLVRTVRELLFRPGQLTVEYFAGQKQRSIPPLRLFLTLFALQFLAFTAYKPAAIYSVQTFRKFDNAGALTRLMSRKAAKEHLTLEQFIERVDHNWHRNLSMLQLVNIIGIAIVLKLLYLRRKRAMVEHLVFAAHFLCFNYIILLLTWPIYAVNGFAPSPLQRAISAVHIALNLAYLYFAQRRYYALGTGKTLLKTTLLWAGTYAVAIVILSGALLGALLQG